MTDKALPLRRPSIITIGVFDGVHIGHRNLITLMINRSQETGYIPLVITFHPHPRSVLSPEQTIVYLSSIEDRKAYLYDLGVEMIVTLNFTEAMAHLPAQEFLSFLKDVFNMHELWTGPDFALGYRRAGNLDVIRRVGENLGFRLYVVPPLMIDNQPARSSHIRELIGTGRVSEAARFLARPYSVSGLVVKGDKRGRQIGFPTANLETNPTQLLPADGVYSVYARLEGDQLKLAVANVGLRPTFGGRKRALEVYIMGLEDRDLYGANMKVEFLHRLRDEKRFGSLEELRAQIRQDIDLAFQTESQTPVDKTLRAAIHSAEQ